MELKRMGLLQFKVYVHGNLVLHWLLYHWNLSCTVQHFVTISGISTWIGNPITWNDSPRSLYIYIYIYIYLDETISTEMWWILHLILIQIYIYVYIWMRARCNIHQISVEMVPNLYNATVYHEKCNVMVCVGSAVNIGQVLGGMTSTDNSLLKFKLPWTFIMSGGDNDATF